MNTRPCIHHISFRFCVENDDAIATLEGALAIVRRLGIELDSLRTGAGAHGMDVRMRLSAVDADALTLCRMRLHNAVGILTIHEMPALVPAVARQAFR